MSFINRLVGVLLLSALLLAVYRCSSENAAQLGRYAPHPAHRHTSVTALESGQR